MDKLKLSDTPPARLRSKRKSSPRSIDHGSSDYSNDTIDTNGSFGSFGSINLSRSNSLLGRTDNSSEGLHHRHPHRYDAQDLNFQDGAFKRHNNVNSSSLLPSLPSSSKLKQYSSSTKNKWVQLALLPVIIMGYVLSMHAHNYYYGQIDTADDETRHQEERWKEMLNGDHAISSGKSNAGGKDKKNSNRASNKSDKSPATAGVRPKPINIYSMFSRFRRTSSHAMPRKNHDTNSNFVFDLKHQINYQEPTTASFLRPAFQRADEWFQNHLENVSSFTKDHRIERRERTASGVLQSSLSSPNKDSVSYSNNIDLDDIGAVQTSSGLLPLWYELNHSTKDTMELLHRRWKRDDNASLTEVTSNSHDANSDFSLCGLHANNAANLHPQNYYPSNSTTHFYSHHAPLGPSSRVLITGILSPLGMHLAIALSRQCNITNFLGIDIQMPNDPLSRLEQQDRLAVLMEELSDLKPLQVPFLGVQTKQRGKRSPRQDKEVREREDALLQLYLHGELDEKYESLPNEESELPKRLFGIPSIAGIDPSGSGALEALLEYRPTHVVHLAGTQAESFMSSKDINYVYPTQDEEEIILKESISNKPHLYQLRMASTGMEQLLSAIVAQSMLPPGYRRKDGEDQSENEENILKKISKDDLNKMKRPHLVYASSYDANYFAELAKKINEKNPSDEEDGITEQKGKEEGKEDLGSISPSIHAPPRGLNGVSGLIDEVLASTYYALHGVSSVGLRFDAIYGPRGFGIPSTSVPIYNIHRIRRGSVSSDVDLAETAVRRMYRKWMEHIKKNEKLGENESTKDLESDSNVKLRLIEEAGWSHAANDHRDFVFVEDAIGAIIAAMQYRAVGDSPATFNIGPGEMSTLSSFSDLIEQLSSNHDSHFNGKHSITKSVIDVEQSSAARSASLDSKIYLQWSSITTMHDGAARTLAWHLDRALPFFSPSDDGSLPLDGEDILSQRSITSCVPHIDRNCLRETPAMPCSSECSTKTCVPSVFDPIVELSRQVTEGCEAVLYTTSLGYNVKKLHLQTQYSGGQEQKTTEEPTLCTLAFVPTESRLVQSVIAKVPPGFMENLNLELSEDSDYEIKVKKLNGHLVHQGWLLIFVDRAIEPLNAEDIFMPKLSPRRLFNPSVRRAMFVDENFSSTPMPDDALFLASEMSRGKIKKRTVMGPNEQGKKIKYKLPEEPPRKAVMMIAPMRNLPEIISKQLPLREITKYLLKEVGGKEDGQEPKEVRVQREFYERARSLINSFDLRSFDNVARHRIQIKDFIRSRWVLHDLKEEEGHQLRCEWYREHVRWNTHLDQLSFAYVMAKRELTRKVITEQPLRTEVEKKTLLQMVIDAKSDAKEWHPIFSGEGTTLPIHASQIAPEAIPQNLQDQHEITEDAPESAAEDDGTNTFYVRIMSDDRMVEARRAWSKARQARLQKPKASNNILPDEHEKIARAVQREKDRH